MKAIIYHNPRCSKSRQTLDLLQARGIETDAVEYLKTPLNAAAVHRLLQQLGLPARDVLRRGEAAFADLGLAGRLDDDAAVIAALVAHPALLERPIVVVGERAALGRPTENILRLLTDTPA